MEYIRPATLADALGILAEHGQDARLLAGGTDLVLEMQIKKVRPRYLIDVSRLSELRGLSWVLREGAEDLVIGAGTPVRDLEISLQVRERAPVLAQAAGSLASVQIRHRATIGGNISHAAPSADTAPALLALCCQIEIASPSGRRTMPLEQFFVGPGQTVLEPCEIVTSFRVRVCQSTRASVYIKHSPRRAMDCAVVGVAAQADLHGSRLSHVRISLASVAPTPVRAYRAEEFLIGAGELTPATMAEAARRAAQDSRPIDDIRASAAYRRRMVEVNTHRALERVLQAGEHR